MTVETATVPRPVRSQRGGAQRSRYRARLGASRDRARRRAARRGGAIRPLPVRARRRARPDRPAVPRGVRRRGDGHLRVGAGDGGDRGGRHGRRHQPQRPHPQPAVHLRQRQRGAEAALPAADDRRPRPGRLRPHRARRRVGRRVAVAGRAARGRRLPADRHEDLDHERGRRGALRRLRHGRSLEGQGRHHRLRGRGRYARVPARQQGTQDGHPRHERPRARLRPTPACRPRTGSGKRGTA